MMLEVVCKELPLCPACGAEIDHTEENTKCPECEVQLKVVRLRGLIDRCDVENILRGVLGLTERTSSIKVVVTKKGGATYAIMAKIV